MLRQMRCDLSFATPNKTGGKRWGAIASFKRAVATTDDICATVALTCHYRLP